MPNTLTKADIIESIQTQNGYSRNQSTEITEILLEIIKRSLESGEDIGLATVYRVLTQFEAAGLVKRHHFEGGHSVFELNQGTHHDHILCVKCGRVDEFVDETIEARQKAIAEELGYEMTDHCLYMYGICTDCKDR